MGDIRPLEFVNLLEVDKVAIPYYLIAASVPPGNRISGFHRTDKESALRLLTDIPKFRSGSFDVAISGSPTINEYGRVQIESGGYRKALRLEQNGMLTFRARADHEFLGWGVDPKTFPTFPKLNPLVIVEANTSFVHLYRLVAQRFKEPAESVLFRLWISDPGEDSRLFLTRDLPDGHVDWGSVTKYRLEESDPAQTQVTVALDDLMDSPNRVAYKVVEAFVDMFDMPADLIPFVVGSDEDRAIDLETIKAL